MKKNLAICAAIYFALNCPLFSQCKTQFHYPLNSGDFWEYRDFPPGAPLTRKVIGDTLMPNGKVYRIIQEYSPIYGTTHFFQRINEDSTAVFKFNPPEKGINRDLTFTFALKRLGERADNGGLALSNTTALRIAIIFK